MATRGAPADRRDPLAHPEPPTRRPCRGCALSAGGLVPAGTDRAGQGPAASSAPRPLQHCRDRRALLRGASAALILEVGGRRVVANETRGSHCGARVCGTRQTLLGWSRLGFGPCVHGGTRKDRVRKHISHVSIGSRSLWTNVVCVKQGHVPTDACNRVETEAHLSPLAALADLAGPVRARHIHMRDTGPTNERGQKGNTDAGTERSGAEDVRPVRRAGARGEP